MESNTLVFPQDCAQTKYFPTELTEIMKQSLTNQDDQKQLLPFTGSCAYCGKQRDIYYCF